MSTLDDRPGNRPSIAGRPRRRPTRHSHRRDRQRLGAQRVEIHPMRNALRLLIPVLTAAVIVLGSGSSVLAAATPTKESLDANWCFTDVTRTYCFDVDGTVHYLDNSAGSSLTYTAITRTSFFEDGQYIGSS